MTTTSQTSPALEMGGRAGDPLSAGRPGPAPADTPAPAVVAGAGAPDITITVYGEPAPQGSKTRLAHGAMVESSKKVKPWRQDVKAAGLDAMLAGHIGDVPVHRPPLDGQLVAEMVFTLRPKPASKPTWWPKTVKWSRLAWWLPAGAPDLSKLARSTEDALTDAGVWKDDARVVKYRNLAKVFVDQPGEPDALHVPGAVIRIWRLPEAVNG